MSGGTAPERSFYEGRTVLVTGHTGFKGSWLATWLHMLGARVIGFALPPEEGPLSMFESTGIARRITSIEADVRNADAVEACLRQHAPEVVFHLAAQSLVRRSYADPISTFATNVLGTAHVLHAALHTPSVRSVVVVTSDKCYDNAGSGKAFAESDPLGGSDPYSASKACAELVTAAYRLSFARDRATAPGLGSARAGNVIGGGDWCEDRLVPDVMRAIQGERPLILRNPDSVRPWQHVLEPLRGYLLLAERLAADGAKFGSSWNFGPRDEDAIPVRELVNRLAAAWPNRQLDVRVEAAGLHEAAVLRLDTTRARTRLGWQPALSIDEAVALTVAWYRDSSADPSSADRITMEQIGAYERLAATRSGRGLTAAAL
ncbi:MAG TPA: CDP-glucose 4,6-dehydratase [Gemmatimonadaceae bacterium]